MARQDAGANGGSLVDRAVEWRAQELGAVAQEWARWGPQMTNWSHFATLTGRSPFGDESAMKSAKKWVRRLESHARRPVDHFIVTERSPAGLVHVHAVVAGTTELPICVLRSAWKSGLSDVQQYDPALDAWAYLTKGITRGTLVDFDLNVRSLRFRK